MRTFLLGLAILGWLTVPDAPSGGYRLVGRWPDGADVTGPGLLDDPHGIDVTGGGDVFVADSGSARVQQFAADGRFVAEIGQPGSGAGELGLPIDVAATAARVYVTDRTKQAVMVYGRDGKFITGWPGSTSPGASPSGVMATLRGRHGGRDGRRAELRRQPHRDDLGARHAPGRADRSPRPRLGLGRAGLRRRRRQPASSDLHEGGRRIDTVTISRSTPPWPRRWRTSPATAPATCTCSPGSSCCACRATPRDGISCKTPRRQRRGWSRRRRTSGRLRDPVSRTLLQAEVINFPYLGRCAEATRFGAFGGAVGLQNASRVSAGPSGSVALMSDAGVSLHDPNGRLRGVVPGTTPPTQGLQPNTNTRVQEVGFFADGWPVVANSLGAQRLSPSGAPVWRWPEPPTPTNPPLVGHRG